MKTLTASVAAALLAASCSSYDEYSHGHCEEDEYRNLNGTCVHVDLIVQQNLMNGHENVECDTYAIESVVQCVDGETGETVAAYRNALPVEEGEILIEVIYDPEA